MGCRKRCVSSCCSCWYCWQWHLNVRIAPVPPGRIRAATWKSQYWLQFLTGPHRTSLFGSPWASRHLPAPRDSHSSVRSPAQPRQGTKAANTDLRALPSTFSGKQSKSPKPVCLCSVARDGEGECHFWNAELISFQAPCSFAHSVLIWVSAPSSHFYNPVLKYFQSSHFCAPSTQEELDALHQLNTDGFYTPASSLQNKEKKHNGSYRVATVCPQNL